MSEKMAPVMFRDRHFERRDIIVGKETLRVENGTVKATKAAHVKALENMHGMTRITPPVAAQTDD